MTSSDTGPAGVSAVPRNAFEPRRHAIVTAAALVPALAAGVWFHGPRVLLALAVSYACGAVVEVAFSYVRRKRARVSWSLLVTGLILPLILPPATPLWMVGLATAFGVFFGQEVFGGEGHNIFSPALVGKCFLLLSWPAVVGDAIKATVPVVEGGVAPSALDLLLGPGAGGVGEACTAAVIVGALVLVILKVASWRTVLATLVSGAALSGALWLADAGRFATPLATVLSGSFVFGAAFLAAHPVTSPGTSPGKWIYGCLIGVMAVLIGSLSAYGTYTEAVMFAVLLGNLFAPAIDSAVVAIRSARGEAGPQVDTTQGAGE
jgi:Na+-transporting NADH:ubiquinone oxidoreductase subunit B